MLQSWTYKAVFLTCLGGCKSTQQSASNIMLISASLKRIVPRVELWENRSQQWSERATSPSRLSVSSVLSMGSANTSSSPHCTCAASLWTAVWACFCSSEMLTHPDIYPSHPASTDIFSAAEKENMSHIITRSRMTNWATWRCSKPTRLQASLIHFFMSPHFSFLSTSQPAWLILSPFPVWMSRIEVLSLKQIYTHYR